MINRVGSVFVHRMQEETGATPEEVTRAFMLARDIFGFEALWARDRRARQPGARAAAVRDADRGGPPRAARHALVPAPAPREACPSRRCSRSSARAWPRCARSFRRSCRPRTARRARPPSRASPAQGVPRGARRAARGLDALYAMLDVTEVARRAEDGASSPSAALYFALVGELELRWFAEKITQLPTDTPWQALARNALRDDLASQQRALTSTVAKLSPGHRRSRARCSRRGSERYGPGHRAVEGDDRGAEARRRRSTSRCSRCCCGSCARSRRTERSDHQGGDHVAPLGQQDVVGAAGGGRVHHLDADARR